MGHRILLALSLALPALAPTKLGPPRLLPSDPAAVLTGSELTKRFELRFRPGSRAEASVDRVAALVEPELDRILAKLGLKSFEHRIRLFLYDDVAELQRITGVPADGYSIPLESHVPSENDQTRLHELVHVVAEKFEEQGPEPRNLFFAEGLANAVLEFVHGVHVDAVAAFYLQRGELPPLAEITAAQDFYAWMRARPGFNAYDVAGSYMLFLLRTQGAAKVRKYYKGASAKSAFGAELETLEKRWHAELGKLKLRPGLVALLEERAGGERSSGADPRESALGEETLGPASAWRKLDGASIAAGDPGRWEKKGAQSVLVVSGLPSQGDWSVARLDTGTLADGMVRCRVEPAGDCFGVQIQLGPACQGLVLRGQGAFVYTDRGGVGHAPQHSLGTQPIELVFRRRGGTASLWIDGKLAVEGPVEGTAGLIGLGSVGGSARFSSISSRPLD